LTFFWRRSRGTDFSGPGAGPLRDCAGNMPISTALEKDVKTFLVVTLLSILATADAGKVVDVSPYTTQNAPQVTVIQGFPNPIVTQGSQEMFTITVALNGFAYSANFRSKRGCRPTDFVVGDPVEAAVDGKNLTITRPDGKTEKAKVVRKARISP
jgi:hypothetical protein